LIDRALAAKRESKTVDFKRGFNPELPAEWCELVKDLVAMANSGGGYIIVGIEDDGTPAAAGSAGSLLGLDPAKITDKVAKYTGVQFDGFEIAEGIRDNGAVGIIGIAGASRPLLFEKPGTYPGEEGKQRTAFAQGTLYVRHGAKSEPATSEDIAKIFERLLQSVRKEWMTGVRRVVNAPAGSTVSVLPPGIRQSDSPDATPIRITDNPSAPEYRLVDPDASHPWRQKELLAEVNKLVDPTDRINQFDMQAVRHLYGIDGDHRFFHKGRFAAPQYSRELRDWLHAQYVMDRDFFRKSRAEFVTRRASAS
jgi:hypothetical protein